MIVLVRERLLARDDSLKINLHQVGHDVHVPFDARQEKHECAHTQETRRVSQRSISLRYRFRNTQGEWMELTQISCVALMTPM